MRPFRTLVVHAEEPSSRLRIARGYFKVSAVFGAGGLAIGVGLALLGTQPFRAAFVDAPLNLLMSGAACAAWWRTGRLLERRERQGALWAIIALAPNVLAALIPEADVALPSFVVGVAGILLIASVWNELR